MCACLQTTEIDCALRLPSGPNGLESAVHLLGCQSAFCEQRFSEGNQRRMRRLGTQGARRHLSSSCETTTLATHHCIQQAYLVPLAIESEAPEIPVM